MTTTAREPSMWDGYILTEDNASPEEKLQRSAIAKEQWERYRKAFAEYTQREADDSGHVEIRASRLEDDPGDAGSIEISTSETGGSNEHQS